MVVEERLPAGEIALDPLEVGRAEAGRDEHRLDPEPIREPGEQLLGGHDLAPLDLAHVLLREPPVCELDLRHSGGAAQRANATGDSGR